MDGLFVNIIIAEIVLVAAGFVFYLVAFLKKDGKGFRHPVHVLIVLSIVAFVFAGAIFLPYSFLNK